MPLVVVKMAPSISDQSALDILCYGYACMLNRLQDIPAGTCDYLLNNPATIFSFIVHA